MRPCLTVPAAVAFGFAFLIAPAAFAQDPPAEEEVFVAPHEITLEQVGESLVVRGRIARTEANPVQGVTIHFDRTHIEYPFRVYIPRANLGDWEGNRPHKGLRQGAHSQDHRRG